MRHPRRLLDRPSIAARIFAGATHPALMPSFAPRPDPVAGRGRLARALRRASLPAALAFASLSAHAGIAQGPMVQAVTDTQAGVWVRTSIDQQVRVSYVPAAGGDQVTTDIVLTSADLADDTASFTLAGLQPGTPYDYQVGTTDPDTGIETWSGTYRFQTVAGTVDTMHIAVVADFHNGMTSSAALRTAIAMQPDLLAVIGDLDHRGPAAGKHGVFYPPEDAPSVLADMRSMHRDSRDPATPLGADFFAGIIGAPDTGIAQIPMVYSWDDHDFCANNADENCPFSAQAVQAFNEYYVLAPDNAYSAGCGAFADFESLSYGTLVQVFFIDSRAARDTSDTSAPTAMLGQCQHDWLVNGLHASTATWKIVMTGVPLNPTMKTWDAWGMFPGERDALLAQIADVPNIVFISADVHSGGAVDDGTNSGRPEVSTPHAGMPNTWVNTFCRIASTVLVSRPGAWTIGSLVDPNIGVSPMNCGKHIFSSRKRTDGLAAPVYPLDGHSNPGYTWIEATATTLDVSVHAANGATKLGVIADGTPTPLELTLTTSTP